MTGAKKKRRAIAALCAARATAMAPMAFADPIIPAADAERGTIVTVPGIVERITDEDEFRLADASGQTRTRLGPDRVPAERGETVTVTGFVDDDPMLPREIDARRLTRGDGTVFTFDRRSD